MQRANNKYKKTIIIFSIIFVIIALFETIGYAAFQQKLAIDDILSSVRIQADIRITDISYADNNAFIHDASTNYDEFNKNSISSGIVLPHADSSVTYKVKITNIGNNEMGIYSLSGLPSNLDYEILDYSLGIDKLCDYTSGSSQCKLGIDDYVNIKIKYKTGMYDSNNTSHNFTLNFDFEPFHTVTVDSSIRSYVSNVPSEVMNKSTLKFNFDESSNMELELYILSEKVDYEYANGEITARNVDGPVEIKGKKTEALLLVSGPTISTYLNTARWLHSSYPKTRLVFTTKDRLPSTAVSGSYNACAEEGKEDAIMIYVNNETLYIAANGNAIKFGPDVSGMFSGNNIKKTITEIVVDEGMTIDGSEAKIFDWMFNGTEAISDSQINNFLKIFEGANPTSMNSMFMNLKQIEVLDLSPFKFSSDAQYGNAFLNATFSGDTNLRTIYADSSFNSPSLTGIQQGTFGNCANLVGGNGNTFNSSKVSSQYARIDSDSTPGYFTAKNG